ncbi:G-type lectin S-receptor-like serine/threonine-protein kinase At1g34300 [Neltuma alba]|uniref:G-type lectin S-receptor-like serine/threonine-protein kinase At1g34300 n=1 Tax=Neltuma alba TaxID=207710 RepID=UPI0010A3C00E|nr:G-type lectin S-receptor-like serine/threonine-protein kinase At1g34300 [Prosopis alba]
MLCSKRLRFLLLSCFFFSSAITAFGISPGSTLFASDTNHTWPSPSNAFSLRFLPSQTPTTSPPSFIAAVVFSGGTPVIWSAGNGVSVDSRGSLQFLSSGVLRLVNGSGVTFWDSGTSNLGVSSASLNDDGNLILSNRTGVVWSSFDHPTDTIVPSQNFTTRMVLRSGAYSFRVTRLGNLTLGWNDSVPYWDRGLNSSVHVNLTSPVLGLQSIGILILSDPKLVTPLDIAYSSDYAEANGTLRILKLDSDGNLRMYSSSRGSGISTVRWAAVEDQCEVFGYCGNYGVCSYKDLKPICECPSENFEMIDPNDSRKGCRRKVRLEDCPGSASMLQLDHALVLTYPPIFMVNPEVFFVGISACRGNCLAAGSCFASTSLSDGTGLCYIKTSSFISTYHNPALPSTSYVKVCGPVAPNPPPSLEEAGKGKNWGIHAWIVVVVVLGTLLALIIFEGGLLLWCCKRDSRFRGFSTQYALLEYASGAPVQFSHKELQRATKGFKEKLGDGGFGAVYRGTLANRTVVAVKQLEGIEQGEKQFRMEVATISSTHHLNLVRLIGFCSEGKHRLLVYEFMKNGSLDKFLFVNEHQSEKLLNWEYRFRIALCTARGITYLHEECRNCIVHCDIKPENILLDENYNAKVSDFGLAKLTSATASDQRHQSLTSVRGTRGYLAPEWLANLPATCKSDVYSFGMVLLEIVSGRRNFEVSEGTKRTKFSMWAYEELLKGNIKGVLDRRLANHHEVDLEEVKRAIMVSFWCIQEQPLQRPTMSKVVQMLEGITETGMPPSPKSVTEGYVIANSVVAGEAPFFSSSSTSQII